MKNSTADTNIIQTEKTKLVILSALFAALTCVSTMIIKIPTPTTGYIHPGDGFVLLSGLFLGPLWGALAAGVGSALSDLIGGYFVFVPATFIIKALTAIVVYLAYRALTHALKNKNSIIPLIAGGIVAEAVMVLGYFLFEIFLLAISNGTSLTAGVIASAAGIIPNIVQGIFGVIIATVLHPVLIRISQN